jgi:hypothetical protein
VKEFIDLKLIEGCQKNEGELLGITEEFYVWFSKLGVAKWGTILKSFYFSQFTINKELVAKLIKECHFKSTKMTNKEKAS